MVVNEKTDMMALTPYISVVIPVYNSSMCLSELLRQLCSQLDSMKREYEVILVDDSSPDQSWRLIGELLPQYPHVRAIQMMRNVGQAKATLCGLSDAGGEFVITMDDDLQHQPDQIPILLGTLESKPELDCVFGVFRQKRHSIYRNIGSKIIRWMNNRAFALPANFRSSSFRAMRRTLVSAIASHATENPTILGLILSSTERVAEIEVRHSDRLHGKSNYTLAKQLRLAFDSMCNVSLLPLRVVTIMGISTCLVSFMLIAIVLIRYLLGQIGVPGWTTVVIIVLFFSGVILLSLGIIGEYLARILREVRGSPPYLVRERIGQAPDNRQSRKQKLSMPVVKSADVK